MVGWIKIPLGTEVGLGPGDIVLDGDSTPPLKRGHSRPLDFSAHVYCGQTAARIRIPLGMEASLGPGDVLDGDPAPPTERGPLCSSMVACLSCC